MWRQGPAELHHHRRSARPAQGPEHRIDGCRGERARHLLPAGAPAWPARGTRNSSSASARRWVEECIQEQVAVHPRPGVNIKRNPLGGRCFGILERGPVPGRPHRRRHRQRRAVQGAWARSLKHFAANNQETDRPAHQRHDLPARPCARSTCRPSNTSSKPPSRGPSCARTTRSTACSPRRNRWLLTDVLRGEWGFKGIVMSDWGAVSDRVAALNAGLNLEMPPSNTDNQIVARRQGRAHPRRPAGRDGPGHDRPGRQGPPRHEPGRLPVRRGRPTTEVARQAAVESMVLLKTRTPPCRSPRAPRSPSSANSPARRATRAPAPR